MASSSGRYQSRLFNWLSQGLSQLEIQSRTRRLKTGIAWGVQLVFYLAHGLTQRAQSAGQGLGQTLQRQLGIGTAPASSQPVKRILLEVEQSYLPAATGTIAGTTDSVLAVTQQDARASMPIRGITTLLTTRTLVLVTEQNQLLDILTPEQQKQLHRRIIWEISDYWYQVRITQAARRRLNPLQAALKRISTSIPKRLAQPITTRLQTQPIELASNPQPQESSKLRLATNSQSQLPTPAKIATALTFLDAVSSQLEQQVGRVVRWAQQGLVPRQAVPNKAPRANHVTLQSLIQAAIAYFFGQRPLRSLSSSPPSLNSSNPATASGTALQQQNPNQNLVKSLSKQQGFLQKLWARLDLTPAQKTLKADALKIQALVQAAIAYFFGQTFRFPASATQAPRLDPGTAASLSGSQQPSQSGRGTRLQGIKLGQEESWLTLADLFGGSTEAVTSTRSGAVSGSMTSGSTTDIYAQAMSQGSSPAVDSNWFDIEIEAILMGYVKHPLEQVLEWLDRGLAWLEELVVTVWAHLRPYLLALFQLIQRYWQR